MTRPLPYKSTPVFDETTLPQALRNDHATKAGVWGLLRVLEGRALLVFHDPRRSIEVTVETPAEIPPQAIHHVEIEGPMRMHVEFHREPPLADLDQ